jgi:hypothetical protein
LIRRVHLVLGLLLLTAFLVTGQFTRHDFPDKAAIDQQLRMLMRSRHIYILLFAIGHILLGLYFTPAGHSSRRVQQYAGSALLGFAGISMVYAFAFETYAVGGTSNYSRYSLYAALLGAGLHFIGGFRSGSNRND